jgi:hypothetical protein
MQLKFVQENRCWIDNFYWIMIRTTYVYGHQDPNLRSTCMASCWETLLWKMDADMRLRRTLEYSKEFWWWKKWKQTMNSVHSSGIMQKTVGYSLCHDFINTIKWLTISKCKKTEAIIMKEQVWLKAQKSYHSKNN